ncbi:hypothetical protein KDI_52250 [Dictyobacter arantiisoli]|uniref:Uncharacterized protein n=1 Tax=Dictyobacter arantiisoli TaxID=2014874 RepID=A0A5A5TJ77_9CHLR|nr:hypothetical protein KDI_52250 [Dictyobacter arantiisoli]
MHEDIPQDTHIYDRNNVLLYDAYDQNQTTGGRRVAVTLQDIPKVMQDAMVATEDRGFWTEPGVNVQSITRAAMSGYGGGSTITQQVIKNLSHNDQPSFKRKLQEAMLALGLTQKYSKAQILNIYFNVAPFGSFDVGVESAAEVFFHLERSCLGNGSCKPGIERLEYTDKGQHDPVLGLARASLLAAMPNSPGTIDPTLGPRAKQKALARQKIVLQAMISQHMSVDGQPITLAMARQAEDIMSHTNFEPFQHTKRAPHFVDWVINQVALQLGNGDYVKGIYLFEHGGFTIRTTLDVNLEEYVERAVDQHLNKPDYQYYPLSLRGNQILSSKFNIHSAAVVVMNARTGEVLAMDGGADYNSTDPRIGGEYNMAAPPLGDANNPSGRPPGATMLPIDDAIAIGMNKENNGPVKALPDAFSNALLQSDISLGVKAAAYAGSTAMRATIQRLGIAVPKDTGTNFANFAAGSQNVSLLQMTSAYQVLADQGQRVPPVGVLDIYNRNGQDVYHYNPAQPPTVQVFPASTAQTITTALSDEPDRADKIGDDALYSFADQDAQCATSFTCKYPVALQSSNTDEAEEGNTAIGYTANVVVGTWVGNVNGARMNSAVVGSTGAVPIWHSVIERALGWCGTQATASTYFRSDHIPCGPTPHLQLSSHS